MRGFKFLKKQLGVKLPEVALSVDSSGHSLSFAWLMSRMGMKHLYLSRLDFEDQQSRI